MPKGELRVQIKDIQEQYPLSLILDRTLRVNTRDMTMVENNNDRGGVVKVRQTARKSTHSKLKFTQSRLAAMSPSTETSDPNLKDSTSSEHCLLKRTTTTTASSNQQTVTKATYTTCSKILPDNKLKIITKKNPVSLIVPVSKTNDVKTVYDVVSNSKSESDNQDLRNVVKASNATASSSPELHDEKPTSSLRKAESSHGTDAITSSQQKTDTQPPIKMRLSTVNGHASIQNVTAVSNNTKPKEDIATTTSEIASTEECTKEDVAQQDFKDTVTNMQKVSPLKIVNNVKPEIKASAVKKKKFGIEKVVQSLNQKQNQVSKEEVGKKESVAVAAAAAKRHATDDSTEIISKKSKLNDIKDEVKRCNKTVRNDKIKTEVDDEINCTQNGKVFNLTDLRPELKKYVQEAVEREVNLRMKLQKKCDEFNKLKEKCEGVERNFQSWIEFANKLQAKVKKIAYAFHKQQEVVKAIQAHSSVQKHAVAVQADLPLRSISSQNHLQHMSNVKQVVDSNQTITDAQLLAKNATLQNVSKNMTATSIHKVQNNKPVSNTLHDIIDLTEECEVSTCQQQENGKIIEPVQETVKRSPSSQVVPPNKFISSPGRVKGYTSTIATNNVFSGKPKNMKYQHSVAATHTVPSNNTGYRMSQQLMRQPLSQAKSMNSLPTLPNNCSYMQNSSLQGGVSTHKLIAPANRKPLPYPPLPPSATNTTIRTPRGVVYGPPPELTLGIKKNNGGIVLSWSNCNPRVPHAQVIGYELYAYQENTNSEKKDWRKIGDDCIAAMDLPMACTLTQFTTGCTYYFTVRGKDMYGRFGPFSKPCSSKDLT